VLCCAVLCCAVLCCAHRAALGCGGWNAVSTRLACVQPVGMWVKV